MDRNSLERVIAHESGHAVVAWFTPTCAEIKSVDIHDDGSGGKVLATWPEPPRPRELWERSTVYLGGLAGEYCASGKYRAAGAHDDLLLALENARRIVAAGNVDRIPWDTQARSSFVSHLEGAFPNGITAAEARILNASLRHAIHLVEEHRCGFYSLCSLLAWKRHLTGKDLKPLLGDRKLMRLISLFG